MKEYIWLKPHFKFSYVKGNVCKLPANLIKEFDLVKKGFVKEFERPKATKKETATK